jgi:hypothetical protein
VVLVTKSSCKEHSAGRVEQFAAGPWMTFVYKRLYCGIGVSDYVAVQYN